MDKQVQKAVADVVAAVCQERVLTATKYLTPSLVVRVARKRQGGKLSNRKDRTEISLVIGTPNYLHRQFIKDCKKAGEPFPVKRIQLKVEKLKK